MHENLIPYALTVFTGFFAIMNPIANTPIFLGLVGDMDKAGKKKVARQASITAFLIVLVFVILGKLIFQLFGITVPAFKMAGGILIFFVGFDMLHSRKSKTKHLELDADDSIAVSPLAIPILAGPGTIVTAMSYVTDGSFIHIGIVILIFAIMIGLTYLAFSASNLILKKVGQNLITVIGKIMGLILTIIGVGMLVDGIKLAFNI